MSYQQTYCLNAANPNDVKLIPDNPQKAAFYYQDPAFELYNEWRWSPSANQWYQTVAPSA